MSKVQKRILIIVGVILVGIIFALFLFLPGKEISETHNWSPKLEYDDYEPYDLKVITELLADYHEDEQFTEIKDRPVRLYLPHSKEEANYVYMAPFFHLHPEDLDHLIRFVYAGNTAFISSFSFSVDALRAFDAMLDDSLSMSYFYTDEVNANFTHADLQTSRGYDFQYVFVNEEPLAIDWSYFEGVEEMWDYDVSRLGVFQEDHSNYIRISIGDGFLLLHSTPLAFSNYYLTESSTLKYCSKVFSHLMDGDIYLDAFSMKPAYQWAGESPFGDSPLQFFLSHKSLRWFLTLVLILTLTYVFFRARRLQRIIPVLPPNENSSWIFTQTIGRLYFQQRDHHNLMQKEMRLFKMFVRERYGLQIKEKEEASLKALAIRSGIEREKVDQIFSRYAEFEKIRNLKTSQLTEIHSLFEYFYQNCK